ncbi:MAG: ABC transporter ATP-binding protein [Lachnospiraceae bacterium]|nr:ABC transporter ATP-binding protein [Lachnospiraceae bacterium]MEE3461623.1 ABC transporter ATP-binding protein [Lachnospiraceae bacterium]
MKRLMKYFYGLKVRAVMAPTLKLLEALMNLLVPLAVARIINRGIIGGSQNEIIMGFIFLIVLAILGLLFSFTAQWFSADVSVTFVTRLRQAVFDHIQSFSYKELDHLGSNTLITRLTSDINQIQNGVNLTLRVLLRSPFIVFGSMIMAFLIDVKCALIFVVTIPALSIVVFSIMLLSIPLFKKVQSTLDRLTGITRENLSGIRVIRAFCKEDAEVEKFDKYNDLLIKTNEKVGRMSAMMNPATYVIVNIATIILINAGAIKVNAGGLMQGDVVALYNYMAQIIVELVKLADLIININKALACSDRVAAILDMEPGMEFPENDIQADQCSHDAPVVEFGHVSFSYAGSDTNAVEDINFKAYRGQTIGIIGGTGSGKTTVANLIPRFYDAGEGSVKVDGVDVRKYTKSSLLAKIGMVPQKAVLFKGTIRDNLRWGNEEASDDDMWEAVRNAQAEDVVKKKDGELDASVEQNGRNFSGGQRQRLTIARALVKKPEILIMDDSSSALDFATDLALRNAIRSMEGGPVIFIISQRTSSIRNADRILVLDDGHPAGLGTHDELLRSCRVYQEIYYSQYPEEKPEDFVIEGLS